MPTTYKFNVEQYNHLSNLSLFQDARVELIRGEIIRMSPKGRLHSACNSILLRLLVPPLLGRAVVRSQEPITLLPDSQPEPDIVIAKLQVDDYRSGHPEASEVLLVLEISDSILEYDRSTKLELYANAGIQHYWIRNLVNVQLEYYSCPMQSDGSGYRTRQIFLPGDTVPLPTFGEISLALGEILVV